MKNIHLKVFSSYSTVSEFVFKRSFTEAVDSLLLLLYVDQGTVYSCGLGENGELGQGRQADKASAPKQLQLPKGSRIKQAACGLSHAALLSGSCDYNLAIYQKAIGPNFIARLFLFSYMVRGVCNS